MMIPSYYAIYHHLLNNGNIFISCYIFGIDIPPCACILWSRIDGVLQKHLLLFHLFSNLDNSSIVFPLSYSHMSRLMLGSTFDNSFVIWSLYLTIFYCKNHPVKFIYKSFHLVIYSNYFYGMFSPKYSINVLRLLLYLLSDCIFPVYRQSCSWCQWSCCIALCTLLAERREGKVQAKRLEENAEP